MYVLFVSEKKKGEMFALKLPMWTSYAVFVSAKGLMRQLPLVGSVLNWFSPIQSSVKGRTFNLASGTADWEVLF